ncbi:hypothetical protein SAMN05428988_0558 [Chitinophaga sp. YR573]|nr:hypothetical protein [Chitinophaga sp. YR573]SEV93181.1 hypothetical protein SAMN05428988_0558 [Chitinophaga sp. YR573]
MQKKASKRKAKQPLKRACELGWYFTLDVVKPVPGKVDKKTDQKTS